jgi:hypothetical protein
MAITKAPLMARIIFATTIALLLGVRAVSAHGQTGGEVAPVYGISIPPGYRNWPLISMASVGSPVNDIRAKLGNELAMRAYRAGKTPFPDGTIIARLAYQQVTSEENNKVFRAAAEKRGLPADQIEKLLAASVVAGPPTNVQFMVKDSKKYAATGGWGFAQFTNGKPDDETVHKTCFACHAPAAAIRLSVSFVDRNGVVDTSWTHLESGVWQTVRIEFAAIRPNPYFQPPSAKVGAPLDLTEVKVLAFAPQDSRAGRLAIAQITLVD